MNDEEHKERFENVQTEGYMTFEHVWIIDL